MQELTYSDLPLLSQDIEHPELEVVARIRKEVTEADVLWIFTPEYNMSYPGHLKNLLDWLSRPVKPMDYGTPTCINGKRVAISGAGGKAATANCRAKLTELLTFMKAEVLIEDYDFDAHKQLVPMQPGDVPVTYADSTALQRDFGFTPKITLREGQRKFAEWYKSYYCSDV